MSTSPNTTTPPPQTTPPPTSPTGAPSPQPSLATQFGAPIPDPPSGGRILVMGAGMILLAIALFYMLFKVWPPDPWPLDANKAPDLAPIEFFGAFFRMTTSHDERLLLLVICAGALGSYVHAATSYSTYVGNRKFIASWTWWYLLRPFVGVALAMVVYFSIRGGFLLLVNVDKASDVNPYGVAAIASLVGLFSKQAADKLNELFSTLFRPAPGEGDTVRRDSLLEGGTVISPTVVRVGAGRVALLVSGINFVETSAVRLTPKDDATQTKDLETSFISSSQLVAYVEAGDTAQEATFEVSVVTPPPGGGTTKPTQLHVVAAS